MVWRIVVHSYVCRTTACAIADVAVKARSAARLKVGYLRWSDLKAVWKWEGVKTDHGLVGVPHLGTHKKVAFLRVCFSITASQTVLQSQEKRRWMH